VKSRLKRKLFLQNKVSKSKNTFFDFIILLNITLLPVTLKVNEIMVKFQNVKYIFRFYKIA
jgi:hypothetical protein